MRGLVEALVVSWHLLRALVRGLKDDLLHEGAPPGWTRDGPWRRTARVPCKPPRGIIRTCLGKEGDRKLGDLSLSWRLQTMVCTCRALYEPAVLTLAFNASWPKR